MGTWWFGRILTFEVLADPAPAALNAILKDASGGVIDCATTTGVAGYAVLGGSIRHAVEPIIEAFAVDLIDDGSSLISPVFAPPHEIADGDLGNTVEQRAESLFELEHASRRSTPSSISLTYYNPERDYQVGQAQSGGVDQSTQEIKVELPIVFSAADARALAEQMIARRWSERDRLSVRLPPRFITLGPGTELQTSFSPTKWRVQRCTIDGMVVIAELLPRWKAPASLAGDAGRFVPPSDVVVSELALALVELPDFTGRAATNPTIYLASSSATPAWKGLSVQVSNDQFLRGVSTARRKTIMGAAETVLANGDAGTMDLVNSVEVQLIDPDQWLTSCDEDALAGGSNLALIGDELIQFADAQAIGAGRFLLGQLLRGRYATQWATNSHVAGELFILIDSQSLQAISLPAAARGTTVIASCQTADTEVSTSLLVDGRSLRTGLFIDGEQVVGSRVPGIVDPSGGTTVDAEARGAVGQILDALRQHGLIAT